MIRNTTSIKNINFYLAVLILFSTFFIFSDIGTERLYPVDDCYFSQKAKEMIQTGGWFTLRFNGKTSLDHAPFYIWLIAIMFKFFGISELSARFFSAFFGIATIVSVYFLGRKLFDEWIGLLSSFVMLTTLLFFIFTRRAMFDVTFTFWVTIGLFAFIKGMQKRKYFLLFGAATGMAILTKSVFGFFPFLIVLLYLLILKDFKKVIDPYFIVGVITAFLIAFPWYIYQYVNYPQQFVGGHLRWLLLDSAFDRNKHGTTAFWYINKLWITYWPWIPLATYSFIKFLTKSFKKSDPNCLIIVCWTVVILGILSFLNIKKDHYMMPVFPALAILSAVSLNNIFCREKIKLLFITICFFILLFSAVIITASPVKLPFGYKKAEKYFTVDEIWSLAEFAKNNIPENEKVILYRIWLWRYRSSFLFYSDRDISASISDKDSLIRMVQEKNASYFITDNAGFSEISAIKDFRPKVMKKTSSLVLFRAETNKAAIDIMPSSSES